MSEHIRTFQKVIWDYYNQHGRELPWREQEPNGSFNPYKILVSEIMLQQTQVARVIPKYIAFLQLFPDIQTLASAPLAAVVSAWSGLGYNRRAKYLHEAAKQLAVNDLQWRIEDLTCCKGVGFNTAAAVIVYAYNHPAVFIETNIRTAYIHHFFPDSTKVHDKELLPLIAKTVDKVNSREWYWALMDYGAYLKATIGNASRRSQHYSKQSTFEGSSRQIRGQILRLLTSGPFSVAQFRQHIPDMRLAEILLGLENDKLITRHELIYMLAN